jgi:hypothetical protein
MEGITKEGVNWSLIEAEWKQGVSSQRLSELHPISRQAIDQMAERHEWEVSPDPLFPQTTQLACVSQGWATCREPERLAGLFGLVRQGVSTAQACLITGISGDSLKKVREEDAGVAAMLAQSRAVTLGEMQVVIADAAKRGDWKAAKYRLETAPETREEYRQDSGTMTNIQINIDR